MLFLFQIFIFLIDGGLTFFKNETSSLNVTAINNIMTSKISVNKSDLNESKALDYLYNSDIPDNQHLDISVFEPEEVKRLFETAQSKGELMEREINKTRRWYYTPGFIPGPYIIIKALDFMKHSIYGTRYRLKDTKHLRKLFSTDLAYQIAILYGSLMQLRIKMDNIYTTLYKFDRNIKFLWYIVLYERSIAATVDANYMVDRIFALARQQLKEDGVDVEYMEDESGLDRFRPRIPD